MRTLFAFFVVAIFVAPIQSNANSELMAIAMKGMACIPANCRGYDGPGGPCYDGPGGKLYRGPGGRCYAGPGGPLYNGPGGPLYNGPGGDCYDGPGGNCYAGPGGNMYSGPGSNPVCEPALGGMDILGLFCNMICKYDFSE